MTELLAALRSLVYMAGFLFLWGWLALQVRSIGWGWALPHESRAVGTVLMIVGGLALALAHLFVVLYEESTFRAASACRTSRTWRA